MSPAPPAVRSFLASNGLTQEAMVRDAQATLTGAMTMHALDATGAATPFFLPAAVTGDVSLQALIAAGGGAAGAVAVPLSSSGGAGSADPAKNSDSKFLAAFASGGGSALPATSTESSFVTTDL